MHFLSAALLSALVPLMVAAADPAQPAAGTPVTAGPSSNTGPVTWADFLTSCQTPGQIALTYSEGPSEATMEMLQVLKEAQARVTFFANATWLQYMQYAGVARHAYLDGHLLGMTYRLPGDSSAALSDEDIKEDIARASRTIQDLIGVYPKYIKIHESNLKDTRLLNLAKAMGYTLVGFNLDEYDYKFNTPATSGQISEVFNAMFSKQMDAYGRKASYVVAGYDVPSTGAASGLPKVINVIQTHGYDMVRLDGCTNDKTPYKKDPILNNGYVGDGKSFGATEYKHGQVAVKNNVNNPSSGNNANNANSGNRGGAQSDSGKTVTGGNGTKKTSGSTVVAAVSTLAIIPLFLSAYFL